MIPADVLIPNGAVAAADADKNRVHLLVGCLFCILHFEEASCAKASKEIL